MSNLQEGMSQSKINSIKYKYIDKYTGKQSPFEKAGIFSTLFFTWVNPMINVAWKLKDFDQNMHYDLREKDKTLHVFEKFEKNWKKIYPLGYTELGVPSKSNGFFRVIWMTFKWSLLHAMILSLIISFLSYFNSWLIYKSIQTLSYRERMVGDNDTSDSPKKTSLLEEYEPVLIYLGILIVSRVVRNLIRQKIGFHYRLLGARIKNTLNVAIFEKMQRKSIERDKIFSIGELVNVSQIDSNRFSNIGHFGARIVSIPFEIAFGFFMLYKMMGQAIFPALGTLLIILGVNYQTSVLFKKYQLITMDVKDKRGKIVNETFKNIRFIKILGLESFFIKKNTDVKKEELVWIRKNFFRRLLSSVVNSLGPITFMSTLYGFHLYWTGDLKLEDAFVSNMVFTIFKNSFRQITNTVLRIIDLEVSANRLSFFLLSEEIDPRFYDKSTSPETFDLPSPPRMLADFSAEDSDSKKPSRLIKRPFRSFNPQQTGPELSIEIKNGNFYWVDHSVDKFYREEKARISSKEKGDNRLRKEEFKNDRGSVFESVVDDEASLAPLKVGLLEDEDQESESPSQPSFRTAISLCLRKSHVCVLKDINMKIRKGSAVAIVGKIGSGKSSLLSAILGDLYAEEDTSMLIKGSTSYVNQRPWIMSKTIKENIIFGDQNFDEARFLEAIKYACLEPDLRLLEDGWDTLLGEKGILLSGGQRMRVSIARAFYARNDICFFDDPISALDYCVGKKILKDGILKYLSGTTRIVTLHAMAYLPYFDYVYILDDGEILDKGTWQELQSREVTDSLIKNLQRQATLERQKSEIDDIPQQAMDENLEITPQNGLRVSRLTKAFRETLIMKRVTMMMTPADHPMSPPSHPSLMPRLTQIEAINQRNVECILQTDEKKNSLLNCSLVHKYLTMTGGYFRLAPLFIVMCVWMTFSFGVSWFIKFWTTQHDDRSDYQTFVLVYVLINLGQTSSEFTRMLINSTGNLKLSKEMNFLMTFRITFASITNFFDKLPMGRILNRFLKDADVMDMSLGWNTDSVVRNTFQVLLDTGAMVYTSTAYVIPFLLLYGLITIYLQRRYQNLQRLIKGLNSGNSTPMVQFFSENIQGNSTVRAYKKQEESRAEFIHLLEETQKNQLAGEAISKWYTLRLSIYSNIVVIPAICLGLFKNTTTAGVFALLLRYLQSTITDIDDFVDSVADIESKALCFEKCLQFAEVEPESGYRHLEEYEEHMRLGHEVRLKKEEDPRRVWPKTGKVDIVSLMVKYRSDLPYVIDDISLSVSHGQKIGIVGRTGSGKTTFISALYRNFEEYEGRIYIDGVELRNIDLIRLRSSMTIIPQDPYIFQDTLKNNLDPLGEHTKNDINEILKEVGLYEKFLEKDGLDTEIEPSGCNLSQGERQLLCLARALLEKKKIVILDEATANIDPETEAVIQKLLVEKFADCTMFVIAHRLNTIFHCDKILFLENGTVAEFDDLEKLRNDPDSHFSKMIASIETLNNKEQK